MLDRPDAGLDGPTRTLLSLDVSCYLQPAGIRGFFDEQLHVVYGVRVRLAVNTDLDDLGSEQYILADSLDDLVGSIGIQVFGIDDIVLLHHLRRGIELPTHTADDDAGIDDRWPGKPSLFDGHAQGRIGIHAVVAQVAHDGKARGEHLH